MIETRDNSISYHASQVLPTFGEPIRPVATGGHSEAVPPQFFVPPQMSQTRKINKFFKCVFSICLIITPTRNITACCVKR